MAKNTYHGEPLQFVSLTPAAMPAAAKVAKIKKQSPRSCDALGVCQAKACGGCQDQEAKRDAKQAAAMAAADAAEAAYWQGWADFEAGKTLQSAPDGLRVTMVNEEAWVEGWLDAQAQLGHPHHLPADHRALARQSLAKAMLALLAGAVLLGVMVWHSARADARLANLGNAGNAAAVGVSK